MKKLFLTLPFLFPCFLFAQDIIKFGKISAADFEIKSSVVDSNSNAVVIADIGSSEFEGNNKGWFTLVYKRLRRIKIINQNGVDAADVSVRLYTDNGYYQDLKDKEVLTDLKGATYNLQNGSISKTELDPKSIFQDRINRNWVEKKFTMPAIKAGSIIEYTYTIKSDFIFNLQPWYFQGKYPCLWSEYTVRIPDCFSYISLSKGYNPFTINSKKIVAQVYRIEELAWERGTLGSIDPRVYSLNANVLVNRWAIKDVPAMKEETMVSTTKNYLSEIEFQLSQFRFTDPPENKMHDWPTVGKEFMASSDFGGQINDNKWLAGELSSIIGTNMTDLEKAKSIFAFVRDNFTCIGTSGIYLSPDVTLKTIDKSRKGTVSDINLLLIAMMKQAGLKVDPVILSTRDHGVVHPVYPILERYNYVIAEATINDRSYLLDASNRFLGFNKLSKNCYNGLARIITTDPVTISLSADSLKERSSKSLFLSADNNANILSGAFSSTLSYDESISLREKLSKEKQEDYIQDIERSYTTDIKISQCSLDSLKNYDEPVHINYNISINYGNEDLIYLNPMFGNALKENPFKSEDTRLFPIEMPYCSNDIFTVNMQIPTGYKIEEMPKSVRIKLDHDAGVFEYAIQQSGDRIQLKCLLQINKAIYSADDYNSLREFYSNILKKENEQIVLKKIK